ncbi:MAG: beta-propeller fold lactonase family protein [Alphaproteobacteria bacterium]
MINAVRLDIRGLPLDQQTSILREKYRALRGTGSVVRAQVDEQPARLYISMLESGYRVALEADGAATILVFKPDGSTPRLGTRGAHSVAAHPDGRIYANTTENRVAVLDASTRKVLRHLGVGDMPSHLELSDDGKRLYVANAGSHDVTIVDTQTDTIVATAKTGKRPLLPCVAESGFVYVPSGPDETVTVLDSEGRGVATVTVGKAPHDIGVSPNGRWAYQPNSASHTITVIDAVTQCAIGELAVGLGPGHVAFTPDSRYAYIANTLSDDVSVVATATHEIVATIPGGAGAHLPVLDHCGRFGYVANFASDDLTVWDTDTNRVAARIKVGIYPHFFAFSPNDRWVVVSNTGESSVCLIDAMSAQTVARLDVGQAPAHIAFDPEGACAFVGCEISDEIAVIDLSRQKVVDFVKAGTEL